MGQANSHAEEVATEYFENHPEYEARPGEMTVIQTRRREGLAGTLSSRENTIGAASCGLPGYFNFCATTSALV